jgi:hypothetical protein
VDIAEVKRRFVEEVKLRAYDDKYIDKNEEREILQIAIQQGVGVDSGRSALAQVCEAQGYVLESAVVHRVKEVLETFAENDGKIDQKEFNDAVSICKKATMGKRNDIQVKRMVIEVIEDNTLKVKQGMFNHWYDNLKKEVGTA